MKWMLLMTIILLAGCAKVVDQTMTETKSQEPPEQVNDPRADKQPFALTSVAFNDGETIPQQYGCSGENIIPPLRFEHIPIGAVSYAIIVTDPDAPTLWDHWVVWNIRQDNVEEGTVPIGAIQGRNSWKRHDYGGPCPPSGEHRYYFNVYALYSMLDIPKQSGREDVLKAMEGKVLAQATLMGRYKKDVQR